MEALDFSEDKTLCKTMYTYRSPMGMAHREFLMM